jgi:hypothetical protein
VVTSSLKWPARLSPMFAVRPNPRVPVRIVVSAVALGLTFPGRLAHGQPVLYVANEANNTIGEYNAATGAPINPTFVNGQGLDGPTGLGSVYEFTGRPEKRR